MPNATFNPVIYCIVFLVAVSFALAQDLTITPSSLIFTSGPNQTFSGDVTVNNTGIVPLSNLQVSFSGLSGYNIILSKALLNLNPGQSDIINVRGQVPSGTGKGSYAGTLTVGNAQAQASAVVRIDVPSMLGIEDIDVTVHGKSDNNLQDGGTIDIDAKPGDNVAIDVRVKNRFSAGIDEDISEIDNIVIKVTIEGIDDGDDLEQESDEFALKAGRSGSETFRFTVPQKVEEDTHTITISVEGEDGDGAAHGEEIELSLDVTKENHALQISEAAFQKATLSCDRSNVLTFQVANIGANDEDQVVISARNTDLGVRFYEGPMEMSADTEEDDNIFMRQVVFTLNRSVAPGTYPFEIRVYYDTNVLADFRSVSFIVANCSANLPLPPPPSGNGNGGSGNASRPQQNRTASNGGSQGGATATPPVTASPSTPGATRIIDLVGFGSFRDSPLYPLFLVFLVLIALFLILALLAGAKKSSLRRRHEE
ncbi:MAG: hypothetical protein V1735_04240 [Nanoarchaeota archaeon]